jgi:hypothetical protein
VGRVVVTVCTPVFTVEGLSVVYNVLVTAVDAVSVTVVKPGTVCVTLTAREAETVTVGASGARFCKWSAMR